MTIDLIGISRFRLLCIGSLLCSSLAIAADGGAGSSEIVAADQALRNHITELYRDGRNYYRTGDLTSADKSLNESLSLWQQAKPHLSHPEKLTSMMRECEVVLERVRGLQKYEALVNGWQRRLEVLLFPEFEIRDADFASTMRYFQERVGKSFGDRDPNFLFQIAPSKLKAKLTLELRNVTAWEALLAIKQQMRIETKVEPHAIVFVDAPEVAE